MHQLKFFLPQEIDSDGDGHINNSEAVAMARRQDDMDPKETFNLFIVADQVAIISFL